MFIHIRRKISGDTRYWNIDRFVLGSSELEHFDRGHLGEGQFGLGHYNLGHSGQRHFGQERFRLGPFGVTYFHFIVCPMTCLKRT